MEFMEVMRYLFAILYPYAMDLSKLEGFEGFTHLVPGLPAWLAISLYSLLMMSVFIVFFFISIFKWGKNKGKASRMFVLVVSIFNALVYFVPILFIVTENSTETFCLVTLIFYVVSLVLSLVCNFVRGDRSFTNRFKKAFVRRLWKADLSHPGQEATEEYETTTTYTYSDGSTRTEVSYSDNSIAPSSGISTKLFFTYPAFVLDLSLITFTWTIQTFIAIIQSFFFGWIVTLLTSIFRKEKYEDFKDFSNY